MSQPKELVVPAGHGRMWRMRKGEQVTIAQTEGQQVGDFIAFNAADMTEFLSVSHTRRRMNFVEALAPFDIPDWRVPDPVNLFQNSPVLPDGSYQSATSTARAGDYVTLLAHMDLIAACSACPQDLVPTNGGRIKDLVVRL